MGHDLFNKILACILGVYLSPQEFCCANWSAVWGMRQSSAKLVMKNRYSSLAGFSSFFIKINYSKLSKFTSLGDLEANSSPPFCYNDRVIRLTVKFSSTLEDVRRVWHLPIGSSIFLSNEGLTSKNPWWLTYNKPSQYEVEQMNIILV